MERAPAGQATHNIHWATLEFVEYLPVSQSEQFVAPGSTPASVIEPAAQSWQYACPLAPWYLPAGHATQASVETSENNPASHMLQLVPPGTLLVSVTEPAWHSLQ